MFIFSSSRFQAELNKIRSILVTNGYPNYIIASTFSKKIRQSNQSFQHGLNKCPVYLHFLWLGIVSTKFESKLLQSFSVATLLLNTYCFITRPLLSETKKNVLPAHHHNNVIYQFVCHCDSRYVGRTSQRLQERINTLAAILKFRNAKFLFLYPKLVFFHLKKH